MKKIIPVLALSVIGAISFASCSGKKDYTCSCKVSVPSLIDTTIKYSIPNVKKSDATTSCNTYGSTLSTQYTAVGGSASCTLN